MSFGQALERFRDLLPPSLGRSWRLIPLKSQRDRAHGPIALPAFSSSAPSSNGCQPASASLPVIALAASAGGIHALLTILSRLSGSFPAPILIAQHLAPEYPSELASILSRHSALSVQAAQPGDRIQPGRVYVAPSGRHLEVCPDETLALPAAVQVGLGRPSANLLFRSLAQSVGRRAVAIVLTGLGRDGADGVRAVKAAGGTTLAQDEPSSRFAGMPRSAAETGCVDFVLPLPAIADQLLFLTIEFQKTAETRPQ